MESEKICTIVMERHEENLFYKPERGRTRVCSRQRHMCLCLQTTIYKNMNYWGVYENMARNSTIIEQWYV